MGGPREYGSVSRGEGPGVVTRDGCSVDVYLKLPYRGEIELLGAWLPPACSVLDLGCGTGRLTRHLLDRGHEVTAVDNSEAMLSHVPEAADKVCADIEGLELGRTFDATLLASHLINVPDDAGRHALLAACHRHLSPGGRLLFQRFDPGWLRAVRPGPVPSIGEVGITIERAVPRGAFVQMSIRYAIGEIEWKQHFTARILDDDDVGLALRGAGFGVVTWIDTRWGVAAAEARPQ